MSLNEFLWWKNKKLDMINALLNNKIYMILITGIWIAEVVGAVGKQYLPATPILIIINQKYNVYFEYNFEN